MKKKFLFPLLISGLLLSACSNQKTLVKTGDTEVVSSISQDSQTSEDINSSSTAEDYSKYDGLWTTDGISHEELIADGGTEISITVTNKTQISGSIYSQQGVTQRLAETDFSGEATNNKLVCSFTDDWDGSGTLNITFKENEIDLEVTDYKQSEEFSNPYGIAGSYTFLPAADDSEKNIDYNDESYYDSYDVDATTQAINETASYRDACTFYSEIVEYEEAHERTDIVSIEEPLFSSDSEYYSPEDFADAPQSVIRVAKNEIYARHGYIFTDPDMNNYFRGMLWYQPTTNAKDFSDSVFNDYEKTNLEMLAKLCK